MLAVADGAAGAAGGAGEGMLAPVLAGGGNVLALAVAGGLAAGICWLDIVRAPKLSDPSV